MQVRVSRQSRRCHSMQYISLLLIYSFVIFEWACSFWGAEQIERTCISFVLYFTLQLLSFNFQVTLLWHCLSKQTKYNNKCHRQLFFVRAKTMVCCRSWTWFLMNGSSLVNEIRNGQSCWITVRFEVCISLNFSKLLFRVHPGST